MLTTRNSYAQAQRWGIIRSVTGLLEREMPRQTVPPVECVCEACGSTFSVRAALHRFRVAQGTPPRFCSAACMGKGRTTKATKEMVVLTCEHCKREFRLQRGHYNARTKAAGHPPKYCSQFCMGAANQVPEAIRTCEHCGAEFAYQ